MFVTSIARCQNEVMTADELSNKQIVCSDCGKSHEQWDDSGTCGSWCMDCWARAELAEWDEGKWCSSDYYRE